ncbi:hypothetical protein I7X12_17590 [Halosimplex litoreum]|uniref:Halobacterial output domain-containing protein n=1 Tax=Halosimplex litoreum TaxID=1198301 RepID=A0A7T3FXR3_9EURY|nr:HalOD1 output domain-containing protein [Halosimplex litoreum]QPV62522.1 hypothetical protein I7X12_17590 [Halosimplex litoreum]
MEDDASTAVLSVLETVAAAERVDPVDLPPLSDTVDPEALNDLFRPAAVGRGSPRVAFEYCGYEVTVDGPDTVAVEPVAPSATATGAGASNGTDASEGPLAD